MSVTTPGVGRLSAERRFTRLADQVRSIRRAGSVRSDAWMLYLGGALMPLGVLLIILGWLGASQTPFVFEQTPYLISGGLLGVGLVIAGGFVYFGYWQSLRIRESRQQSRDLTAAVARLEALLGAGAATLGAAGAGAGGAVVSQFVATPSGSIFHRPDCTVVAGRSDLRRVDPERDGLEACRICDPLADAH